ncbi:MAG: thiopurine S-methyltransferase [Bacteriovoracaceae bacterium]
MDAQFWINAWNEGRTGFHQQVFHDKLLKYFPELSPQEGQKVLVPLCGKSKDLLWLAHLKLKVNGFELHQNAVEAFFNENALSPIKKDQDKEFNSYNFQNITLYCGDFFKLHVKNFYDLIYDRASLVALPASMRKEYAQIIKQCLKIGGKYLLIVYEYDQSKLEGPPFSVETKEIHDLYEDHFSIRLVESKRPDQKGPRFDTLEELTEKVYILEKVR